jgi:hypothetical protein
MAITQTEYDFLIQQDKIFDDLTMSIILGPAPIQWCRQINATISKEIFLLDFYRGSFELSKYTVNKRYKQTVILLRYDNGGRHTNPDGEEFDGPHIHLFKEGFNDKFAYPISKIGITSTDTMEMVCEKIMHFCNVKKFPAIEISMF